MAQAIAVNALVGAFVGVIAGNFVWFAIIMPLLKSREDNQ